MNQTIMKSWTFASTSQKIVLVENAPTVSRLEEQSVSENGGNNIAPEVGSRKWRMDINT